MQQLTEKMKAFLGKYNAYIEGVLKTLNAPKQAHIFPNPRKMQIQKIKKENRLLSSPG